MRLRAEVKEVTGFTKHFVSSTTGAEPTPTPKFLEIVQEEDLYYLFRYDAEGACVADTCHFSLQEAREQARAEFAISDDDWKEV